MHVFPQLAVEAIPSVLSLKHVSRGNAKILAPTRDVEQMLIALLESIRPFVLVHQVTRVTPISHAGSMNVSQTQNAPKLLHAEMRNVWIHVIVLKTPNVMPGTTVVTAHVYQALKETHMELHVHQVRLSRFFEKSKISNYQPHFQSQNLLWRKAAQVMQNVLVNKHV